MNVPVNQHSITPLTMSSLFACDLWGVHKLTANCLLIQYNMRWNGYNQGWRVERHTPVGSGSVTHPHPRQGGAYKNSCPLHLQKKKKKKLPTTPPPCCFPVEWNNLPPSGNPVWVRGPAFSLLLIVCSEEEVKHTIIGTDGCLCQAMYWSCPVADLSHFSFSLANAS